MERIDSLDIAGAEVYELLKYVPREKYYKIPKKVTDLFTKYKDYNIKTKVDKNKRYDEQEISQTAKDIIFGISLNYWITEEEKQKILKEMKLNEEKLKEKYSVDKLFERQTNRITNSENQQIDLEKQENVALVVKQENWFSKFINFIKGIFKR